MIKELLWFLENCDLEFKSDVCSKIITAVEKYSPNKRWRVDTTLTVLKLVNTHTQNLLVASFNRVVFFNFFILFPHERPGIELAMMWWPQWST